MKKDFFNFIQGFLLRYSIYLGILYLLYDNKVGLRTAFLFNPYLKIFSVILIVCFIIKFIQTKTKFYFVGYFIKNYFAIIIISFLFIYTDLYSIQDFFIKSFMFIAVMDFIGYLFLHYTDIISTISNKDKCFFENDEPIKNMAEESIGREDFVKKLKTVFENKLETEKGNVIGLFGKWGEGKSSVIYLLKQIINKDNFEFIFVNPWFNDTKEKMLNAIFGELNNFAKKNYPYKSLESEFNDIVKLSTIKVPETPIEIDLNKFTADKNVQNKVLEVGNILKKYSKRIVIVLDDLDRLNKDNILFILQIVQMFRENTNIVFILSCDDEKLKQILCEISEPYDKTNDDNKIIKTALYYEDYISKIVTVPIKLFKIGRIFITGELIKKLNNIFQGQNIINDSSLSYISTEPFETVRDVKRFYNYFIVAYELVDKKLDIYNFINISILCVFYPELYDNAYYNKRQWFDFKYWKDRTDHFSIGEREEKRNKDINAFFKKLIEQYNEKDQQKLKELIFLISKPYNEANNKQMSNSKKAHSGNMSYFEDIRFLNSYFVQYNPFNIIISNLELWNKENDINQRYKLINDFILQRMEVNQIEELFEYIENHLSNKEYSETYEQICFVFARNSLDIVDKQGTKLLDYVDVSNTIISILNGNQQYDFTKIIEQSSSVVLALCLMHRCYRSIENNFNQLFNNICLKIEKDIELFLKSIYVQENTTFDIILSWLFGKQYFETHKQKENPLDIKTLEEEEFEELKRKVHLLIPYFTKNIDWFKFFVLNAFFNNVQEYNNNKILNSGKLTSIVFQIQLWGFSNIENGTKTLLDDELIELLSKLKEDEIFIKKLAIENILLDKRQGYTDDFGNYAYFKNTNNSHIRPNIISIKDKKEINLLKVEYIQDISTKFKSKDIFEAERNSLIDVLRYEVDNKPTKTYYTLYYICDNTKDAEFIKTDKNILKQLQDLNNEPNIKNYCKAEFKIECKTVDKILEECSFDINDYQKKEEQIENDETKDKETE